MSELAAAAILVAVSPDCQKLSPEQIRTRFRDMYVLVQETQIQHNRKARKDKAPEGRRK